MGEHKTHMYTKSTPPHMPSSTSQAGQVENILEHLLHFLLSALHHLTQIFHTPVTDCVSPSKPTMEWELHEGDGRSTHILITVLCPQHPKPCRRHSVTICGIKKRENAFSCMEV